MYPTPPLKKCRATQRLGQASWRAPGSVPAVGMWDPVDGRKVQRNNLVKHEFNSYWVSRYCNSNRECFFLD